MSNLILGTKWSSWTAIATLIQEASSLSPWWLSSHIQHPAWSKVDIPTRELGLADATAADVSGKPWEHCFCVDLDLFLSLVYSYTTEWQSRIKPSLRIGPVYPVPPRRNGDHLSASSERPYVQVVYYQNPVGHFPPQSSAKIMGVWHIETLTGRIYRCCTWVYGSTAFLAVESCNMAFCLPSKDYGAVQPTTNSWTKPPNHR